jgi:hypothetical protein
MGGCVLWAMVERIRAGSAKAQLKFMEEYSAATLREMKAQIIRAELLESALADTKKRYEVLVAQLKADLGAARERLRACQTDEQALEGLQRLVDGA